MAKKDQKMAVLWAKHAESVKLYQQNEESCEV